MSGADGRIERVGDVAAIQAITRPDATALVCGDRRWTFAELDQRSWQVAHGLSAITAPGARIALLDTNSDTFYELLFGVARADRVLVPINFRLALPEIAFIINDAEADVLVLGATFAARDADLRQLCPTLRHVFVLSGRRWQPPASTSALPSGVAAAAAVTDWDDWLAAQPSASMPARPAGNDVVLQMYTSGTTGVAKGALLTHDNIMVVPPILLAEYGCAAHDVALVCLPLFHVSGSMWGLSALYAGMPAVVLAAATPAAILAAIATHRVTKTFLVPALMLFLVQEPTRAQFDCSSLDLIVYGASPIPVALMRSTREAFGCRLAQVYGLTETCGALTYLRPEDHLADDDRRLTSCGRPLDGVELRVADSSGRQLAAGDAGEIQCRSRQVMPGYWRRDEETQAAFVDGWFRTGDLGYLDHAGYVYIVDRLKDVIITGGEKVVPAEVERVLASHPAVADAAVFGVPDARWGEAVRAVVVLTPGAAFDRDAAIAWARERLAAYKVPRVIDIDSVLPRNAAGKVLKRELRARYQPTASV